VENKDSDGRHDEIVAAEHWANFKARNQSVIVDLFAGALKSRLTLECGHRDSVTFDPYFSLSLPLPKAQARYVEVTVVYHLCIPSIILSTQPVIICMVTDCPY
jgi:ubiquitin C-terminal hydrolase